MRPGESNGSEDGNARVLCVVVGSREPSTFEQAWDDPTPGPHSESDTQEQCDLTVAEAHPAITGGMVRCEVEGRDKG